MSALVHRTPTSDEPELHIASLVVHAYPDHLDAVRTAIAAMEGAEVHGVSEAGKLVATLETPDADTMMVSIGEIQRLPGVLAATLVYQYSDTLAAMNEEIDDANSP